MKNFEKVKKNSSMKKIRKFILILYYNNRAEKICQNSFSRAKFYGHAIFEKKIFIHASSFLILGVQSLFSVHRNFEHVK